MLNHTALAAALAASALMAGGPSQGWAATSDPAAIAHGYRAPRDAWGHPDLSGDWTNATITPLERDAKFGERLTVSDAEAKSAETDEVTAYAAEYRPTDQKATVLDLDRDCGKGQSGVGCGYNSFWVDPGTRLMRLDGRARSSLIVEPANGRLPPMTPEAQARRRAAFGDAAVGNYDGPERRPLGERCVMSFGSSAGPPMLPSLYNNNYKIVQTGGEVAIAVEMVHDVRIIRIAGQHRNAGVRQWMGDSIGHWDGDTLVVETVDMRPEQGLRGGGAPNRVVERFTRVSPTQILYQFELDAPQTYTAPVKGEVSFNRAGKPLYEYACHEGNYALPGILAGARREERAGREMEGNRGEVKDEQGDH